MKENVVSLNSFEEDNKEWMTFVDDLKIGKIKGITAIIVNEDDTRSFIINGKNLPDVITELYYLKRVIENFIDSEVA